MNCIVTNLIDDAEYLLEEQEALLSGAALASNLDPNRCSIIDPIIIGLDLDELDHRFGDALERIPRSSVTLVKVGLLSTAAVDRLIVVEAQLPLRFPVDVSPKPRLKSGENLDQKTRAETEEEASGSVRVYLRLNSTSARFSLSPTWT